MAFESIGHFDISADHDVVAEAFVSQDFVPGQRHMFEHAQDHLPLAYGIARNFLTVNEIEEMHEWFGNRRHGGIRLTEFDGTELQDGDESKVDEPIVRQLYGNPQPFQERFPSLYKRIIELKDRFGERLEVDPEELESVDFAQDIRYITYHEGDSCFWHRDDPTSHFNTIMMLTKPGEDFQGGMLQFHPTCQPTDVALNYGDAVIYSTPKVDHRVTKCTGGERVICLVELKMEAHAEKSDAHADPKVER